MHGSLLSDSSGIITRPSKDDRYKFIQVARALAALAVVIVHSQSVSEYVGIGQYRHGLWSFGQAGVDMFFVISGFIISMVLDRPQSVSKFAARRVLRVVPFYWFFTIAAVLVGMFQALPLPSPAQFVSSLLIFPQANMPVLGVGWSLEHEIIFYVIAASLLALRRVELLFIFMAALSIASVTAHLIAPHYVENGRDLHLLSLYHLQFLVGVALCRYRATITRLRSEVLLISGLLLFPLTGAVLQLLYQSIVPAQPEGWIGIIRVSLWGLSSAFILAGLLAWENTRPTAYRTKLALAFTAIGDASYTLYLSHPITFALVGFCLKPIWPRGWPAVVVEAIATGVAIGFALLFYRSCEKPLLARLADDFGGHRWNAERVR